MNHDPGGVAASLVWQHRSTLEVPKADRFDFWRQFPAGNHMQHPLGTGDDFFGEFSYASVSNSVGFVELGIDPCLSRFEPGAGDWVDIGVVNSGALDISYGRDCRLALRAGSPLVAFDPTQPMTVSSSRSDLTYLRLPRAAVAAAVGRDAASRAAAVRPLVDGVLTTQLAACMQQLRHRREQTAAAAAQTLREARALALVVLAHSRSAGHRWPGVLEQALYRAACHQLAQSVANPVLTVDHVAAELGCSRAQIYRLFAARGQSVAGYLYELRMQRAARLLSARPGVAIGTIAMRCGYGGPIAFDKAFRRRFGMTPSDWRALHATEHSNSEGNSKAIETFGLTPSRVLRVP